MLLSLIEIAGNHVLEFDPSTQARLKKLTGKTIAIEIKQFQPVYVTTTERGIMLTHDQQVADVTLKVTLKALVKLSQEDIDDIELESGELEIIGDALTGQRFAKLLSEMDIDWEEILADKVGDSAAQLLSNAGQGMFHLVQQGRSRLHEAMTEILSSELIIPETQANSLYEQISQLEKEVARLQARVEQLSPFIREQA